MQRMDRRMADEIKMIREEMNGVKENVEGVWTAMKTGKEEMTNKISAVKQEVGGLGQGIKELKKGQ